MSDTHSCVLYHGPTAQGRVSQAASEWGVVVGVFGDPRKGLDTDTVREALALLESPPISDRRLSAIVGPVDVLTRVEVMDTLLKILEEGDPRLPRAYLWAKDVGSVRATILSRCLLEWCPGQVVLDQKVVATAQAVITGALSGSTASVLSAFAEIRGDWKTHGSVFLAALAQVLSGLEGTRHFRIWEAVRPLAVSYTVPTYGEVVERLLP